MWHFITSRPTYQIDGGTMNIFMPKVPSAAEPIDIPSTTLSMTTEDGQSAPMFGATSRMAATNLHVGFAACFPAKAPGQYTEHWVLFPTFRSPRVAVEGAIKRAVDPLILEAAEPNEVLPGGWRDENEFLAQVRAFIATRPKVRYIRHLRTDSVGFVP